MTPTRCPPTGGSHSSTATGGDWRAWSAALLRYLERHGPGPTQAIIISQPARSQRYVQMQIGHGFAHVETGINVYMMGESRLTDSMETALAAMGWLPPESDDDPDEMPANWRLPLLGNDWPRVAEMLVTTMVGVLEFDEAAETKMRIFRQQNSCRNCWWLSNSAESQQLEAEARALAVAQADEIGERESA